jgi:hypothetical protein
MPSVARVFCATMLSLILTSCHDEAGGDSWKLDPGGTSGGGGENPGNASSSGGSSDRSGTGGSTGGTQAASGGTPGGDESDFLFRKDQVLSFYLELPPASFAAIDAEAVPGGCFLTERSYYEGTLRFEQHTLEKVGIRAKGGCGSARSLSEKAAFKVNLEWDDPAVEGCPPERSLYGLSKFTFNNAVQDVSMAHERLGYRLYQELGVPSPRVAHVRLYVNGEYWGTYVHVETPSRRFLKRWFSSNDGMMYEGAYGADLSFASIPGSNADETNTALELEFKPGPCQKLRPNGDPLTYDPVVTLIRQLDALDDASFYPAIRELIEFDRFLSMWAVDAVISHWDGYIYDPNNYRVYHDPGTGKWTFIPYGIDQTFDYEESPNPFDAAGRIASSCLRNEACKAAYRTRLAEAAEHFEKARLDEEANATFSLIRSHVEEDPRREFEMPDFENAYDTARGFIAERPSKMRSALSEAN